MDLGAKIKKYRAQLGMDQRDLAHRLNVSPKTVSSWEVNRTQPKMEMIDAMCKVFGCKRSDFLDEDVQDEPSFRLDFNNITPGMPPEFMLLLTRLINVASKCTYEELAAVVTLLEASQYHKGKED